MVVLVAVLKFCNPLFIPTSVFSQVVQNLSCHPTLWWVFFYGITYFLQEYQIIEMDVFFGGSTGEIRMTYFRYTRLFITLGLCDSLQMVSHFGQLNFPCLLERCSIYQVIIELRKVHGPVVLFAVSDYRSFQFMQVCHFTSVGLVSGFNWLCAELRNILIGVNGVARCFACWSGTFRMFWGPGYEDLPPVQMFY